MKRPLKPGPDGIYHPANEQDLLDLLAEARTHQRLLRVRGSGHSFPSTIIAPSASSDPSLMNVLLNNMNGVRWDDVAQGRITAQGGCHLALDPRDTSGASNADNGLLPQMFRQGWAVQDLGGITHQTVAGFLSTGSAGGTVRYSLEDNIQTIRLVDGTGKVWILDADNPDHADLFAAAGVSMGLLGVITEVTFQGIPQYNIQGNQATTTADDCAIDLFGPGTDNKPGLEQFLRETEYTRLLWWPQKNFDRVVVWQAERIPDSPDFQPQPYKEFDAPIEELLAGVLFTIIGNADEPDTIASQLTAIRNATDQHILDAVQQSHPNDTTAQAFVNAVLTLLNDGADAFLGNPFVQLMIKGLLGNPAVFSKLIPELYNLFVPLDTQTFQDYAWRGLPMDNGISDVYLPTWFTELWAPLEHTQAMMTALREYFDDGGLAATGTFSFEIYAARESKFWMSPAYGTDVVRFDAFWFGYNNGSPDELFQPLWDLFVQNNIPFRLHWGKYRPSTDLDTWVPYFAAQSPRWNDFLELRKTMDPHNLFLTDYWRQQLGIR